MTGKLAKASRSGVYRAPSAKQIMDAARDSGLSMVKIRARGKEALLKEIAAALEFPSWFGHNWDALEDCLSDLSWHDAAGYLLVFDQAEPGDELGVLIDVLRSSAEYWAARGKPFLAVFVDPARKLELPELSAKK